MTSSPFDGKRWTPSRTLLAPACLVILVGISLPWLVIPVWDATNDSALYISTAQSLLRGEGYSYMSAPFTLRPPGFSILLVPVLGVFGVEFYALNLFVSLLGATCMMLLYFYLKPRVGDLLAASCAAGVWLNPGFQKLCNHIQSDIPALAAILLCLLVERVAERKKVWQLDVVVAICLAAAAYLRSINLLLVPAIVLARLFAHRAATDMRFGQVLRRCAIVGIVPLLLIAPWWTRNAVSEPFAPGEQTYIHSYSVAMLHSDPGDPTSARLTLLDLIARVPRNLAKVSRYLGDRLTRFWPPMWTGIIGVPVLCGLAVVLTRRREPGEIFAFLCLGVLLIYFSIILRLVLPIYVFALPALLETLLLISNRVRPSIPARAMLSAAVLIVALVDFQPGARIDDLRREHEARSSLAAHLRQAVPREASIAADVAPIYAVYLDRPVYHLRATLRKKGWEAAAALLGRYDVAAVILDTRDRRNRPMIEWLEERHGPARRFGSQAVSILVTDFNLLEWPPFHKGIASVAGGPRSSVPVPSTDAVTRK